MGANLSQQDIMNMALDYLDEIPLASAEDTSTKPARLLRRNFAITRDILLRSHPFNFATTRVQLAESPDTPAFEWDHAYPLPADCLRVLPLQQCGAYEADPIPYMVEKHPTKNIQLIVTDQCAPLDVRYIAQVTATGMYDALFCDWLACRLAKRICLAITGKGSYFDRLQKEEAGIMAEAKRINALEGVMERPVGDEWDNARMMPAEGR